MALVNLSFDPIPIESPLNKTSNNVRMRIANSVMNTKENVIATEAFDDFNNPNSDVNDILNGKFQCQEYFVQGLTPKDRDDLLAGKTYLEFWIVAMDHEKFTANRRKYPQDVFLNAVAEYRIRREMQYGGLGGEKAHPIIKIAKSGEDPQDVALENARRTAYKDPDRVTHYLIDVKVDGTRTLFKIKTSTSDLTIVKDILNGLIPCFSIRSTAKFRPENGMQVAIAMKFFAIDYVRNPGNESSTSLPDFTIIDSLDLNKKVNFKLLTRPMGNGDNQIASESLDELTDLLNFIGTGEAYISNESYTNFVIDDKSIPSKKDLSFEKIMSKVHSSIL